MNIFLIIIFFLLTISTKLKSKKLIKVLIMTDQVCVVVGGGKGMGAAIAREMKKRN